MKEKKMVLDGAAFHFVISAWVASRDKDKALQVFRELRAPRNVHLLYVELIHPSILSN